ncbi:hypothetical protein GCM10009550_20340 [Actinocorallia libanotica]|uniref:DNA (cytosine-5-)-methyltransferase n=1 Tax=Actinocorallia libanotica TaxID=46162 RepID=A0ABP4B9B5_9ACTN
MVGVEWDADAVATARAAGHERLHADVRSDLIRRRNWGQLDGYTAGPPCQTFTTTGNGDGRRALDHLKRAAELVAEGARPENAIASVCDEKLDERSVLVLEPLLVIARHRPKWVLLEQVPTVLPIWKAFAEILAEKWGYHVRAEILNSEQYGVAQTRKRAFLAAHLERPVSMPAPTHSRFYAHDPERLDAGVCKWVSMEEALADEGLPAYGGLYLRSNYGTGGDASRRGERLISQPSFAVTGKVGRNKWHGRLSGNELRRVSHMEAGVFQSFPADYPWQGASGSQYQQIGNAAPPKLVAAVMRELVDAKPVALAAAA